MRIVGIAAKWLFMLCLPVLLVTLSIGWIVNSLWLYKYGFDKYDVSQTTGLADSELEKAATGLIGYFNSDEEYISLTVVKDGEPFELFNQREIIHLKDVKGLIWLDYWVLLGTLVYVLAYAGVCLLWRKPSYWRRLAWGVVGGGGITLALMLALGLGILLGFSQFFWQFHVIFFSNEFWLLDPTKDYLIMLVQGVQYDAVLFIIMAIATGAVVLGGVAGGYLLSTRGKATA